MEQITEILTTAEKANRVTHKAAFGHHEQVRVELLKVTQAVHRWTGGVVVRQDDDVIVFRGRRTLLPFYAAGYTQEMTFKCTVNDDNNFNISKTRRISCKVQPFKAYEYKADISFSYAPLRIKSGAFSHVQCTAGGCHHQKCLG